MEDNIGGKIEEERRWKGRKGGRAGGTTRPGKGWKGPDEPKMNIKEIEIRNK